MTPWDWLLGASIALFAVACWMGFRGELERRRRDRVRIVQPSELARAGRNGKKWRA